MISASRKHRVLSTHPLSPSALKRLSFFFDVQIAAQRPKAPSSSTISLLQDVAGVITDQSTLTFAKETVEQLPHLRAICLLDTQAKQLDLDVLTQAGIRATGLPDTPTDGQDESLWTTLTTTLQNHPGTRPSKPQGLGGLKPLKRFAGSLFSSSVHDIPLAILGSSKLAQRLHDRALQAQARPYLWDPSQPDTLEADWLIIPPDWANSPGSRLDLHGLARLPAHTRILDLCSPGAVNVSAALLPEWQDRIIHRPTQPQASTAPIDISSTVAEQLIAALGFGRKGWHPDNLLNPDVCCESCC